jgi:hypothetical protein
MNNHRGRTDVYTDCAGNDKVTFSCAEGDTPAQVLRTVPMELTPQEIAIVKAYLRITDLSKVYFSASGNLILVDTAGNEYDAGYARGLDGDTPYIGEDNYWYIAGQSTGVPAYGLAVMPRIGDNGNWFIGDTDTGVPARGEDYVLTAEDKQEIKDAVLDEIDLDSIGLPEVYIGDAEPEDGTVLWVDTDDDSVDDVLGVSGASVGQLVRIEGVDQDGTPTRWAAVEPTEAVGVYELIDTIAVADGVTNLFLTAEPDGTAYRFEAVFLKMSCGETAAAATTIGFYTTQRRLSSIYLSAGVANGYAGMQVWKDKGYWTAEGYAWRTVDSTYGYSYRTGNANVLKNKTSEGAYIERISGGVTAGMTVEIWAVRARS